MRIVHVYNVCIKRVSCVCSRCVPVVRVVGLGPAPPDVGVVPVPLGAVGVALLFRRAAHKLHPAETVDAARQQHPVVMEIHGAVAAGLRCGGGGICTLSPILLFITFCFFALYPDLQFYSILLLYVNPRFKLYNILIL